MPLTVLDHPISRVALSGLRDKNASPARFRALTETVTKLLVMEASRSLSTRSIKINTPLEETEGADWNEEVVAVPILRAGLSMLDMFLELLPHASVGFIGLARDEETAVAASYYTKLPTIEKCSVFLLDPMLATGGSAEWAIERILAAKCAKVTLLCIVAAPEGVARLLAAYPSLNIITAALDRELNDKKYILPGLGDFGDRLYNS